VDLLGVLVEGVAVLDVLLDLNLRPTVDQIHELVVFLTRVYITASQSFVIFLPRKEIFYLVFPDFQGKFHMYVERSVESTFSSKFSPVFMQKKLLRKLKNKHIGANY
jgi:hypothetical protein